MSMPACALGTIVHASPCAGHRCPLQPVRWEKIHASPYAEYKCAYWPVCLGIPVHVSQCTEEAMLQCSEVIQGKARIR